MEMPRVLVFDHLDNQVCELSPNDVFELTRTEEINGANSLEITSSQPLAKEQRVLVRDMMGLWREYVVVGVDEAHLSGNHATGTYYCEWGLKHDLQGVTVIEKRPGVGTPVSAGVALDALLSYTRRWTVGVVTVTTLGGLSLYWVSAWVGLGKIVDEWGGEVRADITVSSSGVISRKLSLLEALGNQVAKRRFDFGYDLTSIRRKVEEEPLYCRIYPRGKGEETDSGGYGRRITIESANNGVAYIENADTAQVVRLPDGMGGYEYPSVVVENSEIDDPAELKSWGDSVLDDYTTPKVTYAGTVEQFAAAGMSAKGVSLGDAVQCADREFTPDAALRVNGRVVKIVVDERDPFGANLTIGYVSGGLASLFGDIGKTIRNTASAVEAMNGGTLSTADYLERLIDRINAEINATGGYTYIKPGEGIWVYDKAEDQDPTQVVRVMGGSISIANTKTAQGEWNWETMLTGRDGILASAITAAHITSGWIGSADASGNWTGSGNYINFDTGEVHLAATVTVGDSTVAGIAQSAVARFVEGDYADTLAQIRGQIDGKAETWYQATDPASGWTNDQKAEHTGDLWYKTTDSTTWRYSGSAWVEQKAPDDVFDKIDGKAQIFVSQPKPPYNVGDLWFNSASSDIMTCTNARASGNYAASDWAKRNKYTDDSALTTFLQGTYATDLSTIRGQIDGKAETWYQATDPASGWTNDQKAEHTGDLWYKTTDSTTWRYSGSAWVEQKAPDDVFDKIDGKAQIFVSQPKPPYNVGDLWFNSASSDIMTCTNARASGNYAASDWAKRNKYTDDSAVTTLDNNLNQTGVFNRLTNNGQTQGIYLSGGKLYINGSYVGSGVIDAQYVYAGTLRDKKGRSSWDLTNGTLTTNYMTANNITANGTFECGSTYKTKLQNGTMYGYQSGTQVGYIDFTASSLDLTNNQTRKGIQIQANGIVRISSPRMATAATSNVSTTATFGFTGWVKLNNVTFGMNSNMTSCHTGSVEFKFINGLFTGLGSWTTDLVTKSGG